MDQENVISYRDQIRSEYDRRALRNPQYSLRAFARDLDLDPGQLSSVLNAKKNLSLSRASEISRKLFRNPREMQNFYHSVELELARKPGVRSQILVKLRRINAPVTNRNVNVSEDEFAAINDWYNVPLLELSSVNDLELTPETGALYFGIADTEARLGLMALARLGFVKKVGSAYRWVKSLTTTTEVPSFAIKRFHHQMIQKAIEALFHQPVEKRFISSLTMKIPQARLPEVKKMIDEHEKRLLEFAQEFRDEPGSVVYQFNTQLFSLKDEDHE